MALLGGGCGAVVVGQGPAIAPARLDDGALVAVDGLALPLDAWRPPRGVRPRGVILALHGFNDYARAFDDPARFWASRGLVTYAYDQRGFGRTASRGLWPGTDALAADAAAAIAAIRSRHPGLPLYLLGESMGGAVAIIVEARPAPPVDGVILVAPAVWGYDDIPFPGEPLLALMTFVVPWSYVSPPAGVRIVATDNPDAVWQMRRDPNVLKVTRIDALAGLVALMDQAKRQAGLVRAPVLFLYGLRDQIVPFEPMNQAALELAESSSAFRRVGYEHGYHMLLRDRRGARVWRDVADWIADPDAALRGNSRP